MCPRLLTLCVLLWSWSNAFAEDSTAQARAATWAKTFEDSLAHMPATSRKLAEEVADFCKLSAERKAALGKGSEAVGAERRAVWMEVYTTYHLRHEAVVQGEGCWDYWDELLTTDPYVSGMTRVAASWDQLLQSQLKPEELALWKAEAAARMRRANAGVPKAVESAVKGWELVEAKYFNKRIAELQAQLKPSEERRKQLLTAQTDAMAHFRKLATAYMQRCTPKWEIDYYRLSQARVSSLAKGSLGTIIICSLHRAEARKKFDQSLVLLLSAEEREVMKGAVAAREKRLEGLLEAMADSSTRREIEIAQQRRTAALSDMVKELSLSEERAKPLRVDLEKEFQVLRVEWRAAYKKEMRARAERILAEEDEDSIKQWESGRRSSSSSQVEKLIQAKLKGMLQRLMKGRMTDEELSHYEEKRQQRASGVAKSLAMVVVSELDLQLNLLPEQRVALERVAEQSLQGAAKLLNPLDSLEDYDSTEVMLGFGAAIPEAEAKKILDAPQAARMKELVEDNDYHWDRIQDRIKAEE
jgi:hypothetical protein